MAETAWNQPPPLDGFDPLACDPALIDAVHREGAADALPTLKGLGAIVASAEAREHARLADVHPPVLHTHDRHGRRRDEVEFHPSWHWLMGTSVGWGLHGTPWVAEPGSGAHVARAAGFYLMNQLEAGHCCPIAMTYAAVPALRHDPELAARFEPGLRAQRYSPVLAEPGSKPGLLAGMATTETHAGSDLRAVTAQAEPLGDGTYCVVGEALECLGGDGYVEDSGLPRLYREAPLNSIWEGSGNVVALDVLRAVSREPDSAEAVLEEIDAAAGADEWFDRGVRELRTELRGREERRARRLAEMLALCLQGSLLLRYAPDDVASAFVSSRFLPDGPWRTAGTLPAEAHVDTLVERVTPSP